MFRVERDVTVVEDAATRRIVSALFLIPQVWSYAGVPMQVGQPELIATHPDYRRRGLVRAQFEVIHERSRAAGHLWQFISGIARYYRQFGYSYALDLPPRPIMWLRDVAPPSVTEFSLRSATSADVEFLAALEAEASSGTLLCPVRGADGFALELARRPGGLLACEILVVEPSTAGAAPRRLRGPPAALNNGVATVRAFELRRGVSWLAPTAAVWPTCITGSGTTPTARSSRPLRPATWPSRNPLCRDRLGWGPPGSYAFYVRVPDIVAFVRAITPVLEARGGVSCRCLDGRPSYRLVRRRARAPLRRGTARRGRAVEPSSRRHRTPGRRQCLRRRLPSFVARQPHHCRPRTHDR